MRAYLKRFLFTDERITTQVKYLSGGERSRLLLARILKNGGNFLVLDEPTNDLDLPTLRVLEEALDVFPASSSSSATTAISSNRVCTGILAFEGEGKLQYSVGDYDYYMEKKGRGRDRAASSSSSPSRSSRGNEALKSALEPATLNAKPSTKPRSYPSKNNANSTAWKPPCLLAKKTSRKSKDIHRPRFPSQIRSTH